MNIVFDIGNVLVQWDPRAPYRDHFDTDEDIDAFFEEIDFYAWNTAQDQGRSRAEAVVALRSISDRHAALGDHYFDAYGQCITEPIVGSWKALEALKEAGHRIFMITNWSADLFPIAEAMYPQLRTHAEDIVISGVDKVAKPDAAIFNLLTRRNGLEPAECLFIDDSEKNVVAARTLGWQGHHFTGPEALVADLTERGLL